MRTILYVGLCLLTGCLARPHLDKQSFIFAPPSVSMPKAASTSRTLGIRTLQVAEPFEGRSFVYRTGAFSYDRDPYAEFMVHPADALLAPIASWFRDAGTFSSVIESGSALKPDTLAEIQVLQLYGDFRSSEHPVAVMTIRFVFFDAPAGVPGKIILQHDYSRSIPLKTRTAADLIDGWNQALARILDSVTSDFARAEGTAAKP